MSIDNTKLVTEINSGSMRNTMIEPRNGLRRRRPRRVLPAGSACGASRAAWRRSQGSSSCRGRRRRHRRRRKRRRRRNRLSSASCPWGTSPSAPWKRAKRGRVIYYTQVGRVNPRNEGEEEDEESVLGTVPIGVIVVGEGEGALRGRSRALPPSFFHGYSESRSL